MSPKGNHTHWSKVSMPPQVAALPTDHRGYPIPFVVARGLDGTPLFTINNHELVYQCAKEFRCNLCGEPLVAGDMCFSGGPLSAFHANGGFYFDGPMHHECARYALQVCPYLAAPKYVHRIDAMKAHAENINFLIAVDPTMLPERPDFFVLVRAFAYGVSGSAASLKFSPQSVGNKLGRFHDFEVWQQGVQITSPGKIKAMIFKALREADQRIRRTPTTYFIKPGTRTTKSPVD